MKKNKTSRGTYFSPLKNLLLFICIASVLMISGSMQVNAKAAISNELLQSDKKVTGKVTDSSGATLPGVSVVVKGTTIGIITDMDGKYELAKVPENATLQFSFVGMVSQEIAVGNKSVVDVVMADETIGIEEVVAIGYGYFGDCSC